MSEFAWSPEAIEAATKARWCSPHARDVLDAAVEAQPVVARPPCPTCRGEGDACDERPFTQGLRLACPTCGGSGCDRLIPESEIRAWIQSHAAPGALPLALDDLQRWLDERRSS
jgi:hypothetical protein